MTEVRFSAATHVGLVRQRNEDCYCAWEEAGGRYGFFAVADGLGGHTAGEVASRLALETASAYARRALRAKGWVSESAPDGAVPAPGGPEALEGILVRLMSFANGRVFRRAGAEPDLRGMGTTLTALLVAGPWLGLAHVGDSRAYLLRGGEVLRLTTDHSLVEEMVRTGELSEGEARRHPQRHVLTRALGVEPNVAPDLLVQPARGGDIVVLATDGVTALLGPEEIAGAVLEARERGMPPAERLVGLANARGGYDNATCVVVELT